MSTIADEPSGRQRAHMPGERESLGAAKPESFGVALKNAIRQEFGTSKAFANAVGVSEGRISQIVSGPENVNPESLERVLLPFGSIALQEQVHAAWVKEFAPLPEAEQEPMDPDRALAEVKMLWQSGNPKRALRLATKQRQFAEDLWLWQELSGLIVMTSLRLSRPSLALKAIAEIERRSRIEGERSHLLTALWMRGAAVRNLEHVPLRVLDKVHQDAVNFANSFEPCDEVGRRLWRVKRMELHRDFALHVLSANERKIVPREALEQAHRSVEEALRMDGDLLPQCFGLEVRARVEVAMGQLFRAEETLEEAESLSRGQILELWEKTRIVRARILAARGEKEQAEAELEAAAEQCFETMNLHHHRVAEQLLSRILAGV